MELCFGQSDLRWNMAAIAVSREAADVKLDSFRCATISFKKGNIRPGFWISLALIL